MHDYLNIFLYIKDLFMYDYVKRKQTNTPIDNKSAGPFLFSERHAPFFIKFIKVIHINAGVFLS